MRAYIEPCHGGGEFLSESIRNATIFNPPLRMQEVGALP